MSIASDFVLFLVEDSQDDFLLFDDALKREGLDCHVRWFTSGEDALAALSAQAGMPAPHLLISDLDMPGIGGHALLEQVRADARLRSMPVIIMTSSLSEDDRAFCALADHYFVKPRTRFEWGIVTALVRRYMHKPAAARPAEGGEATGELPLILHIEDQPDDRDLFELAFQRSGVPARLHQVGSAEEAYQFLQQKRPIALIVLDLSLPGSSGKELLEDLRASTWLRQVPVIILSGSDRFSDMQDCRDLYVIDYVMKPGTPRQMSEFISTFRQWFDSTLAQSLARQRDG